MNNRTSFIILLVMAAALTSCMGARPISAGYPAPHIDESLSSPEIHAFAEDPEGFIWMGTLRGLNRYDGERYDQYYTSSGLPDNEIYDILPDSGGRLWVTTAAGACFRDRTGAFHAPKSDRTRLVRNPKESLEGDVFFNNSMEILRYIPESDSVAVVLSYSPTQLDSPYDYHFPSEGKMLLIADTQLQEYDTADFSFLGSTDIPGHAGVSLLGDDGILWIATNTGLYTYDTRHQQGFEKVPIPSKFSGSITSNYLLQILPYPEGRLLFNTSDKGILSYDIKDGTIIDSDNPRAPIAIRGRQFMRLFADSKQNLWATSYYEGFSFVQHNGRPFAAAPNLSRLMEMEHIVSVGNDSHGNLWLCSTKGTVFRYTPSTGELVPFPVLDLFPNYNGSNLYQLYVDSGDGIWITSDATEGTILCKYAGGKLARVASWPVSKGLSFAEEDGYIWMGAWSNNLYRFDLSDGSMQEIPVFPEGYTHISAILMTDDGLLAGAFSHPLIMVDTRSFRSRTLIKEADWKEVIKRGDYIPTSFFKDRDGDIWIGTDANGLIRYTPSDGSLKAFPGAPCEDIASVEEDGNGHLWVSTQYGLGQLDKASGTYTNYTAKDGLAGNTFFDRSSLTLPDGNMVFGGAHGVTVFNPDDARRQSTYPLVFTSLKVNNQLVQSQQGGVIEAPLASNPPIHLGYKQHNLNISFAALTYSVNEQPRYHYKMEGLEEFWTDAGISREASYPSLPPGKYTFHVRIDSPGGIIAPVERSIPVIVDREPWNTLWARLAYLLAVAGIIWAFLRYRSRTRSIEQAAREAASEKEREKQINRMNARYFANIAHEFRTPLTLIAGPLGVVRRSENLTQNQKRLLSTVDRNTGRMLRLVGQLLDFNKLDNDALRLKVAMTDIVPSIQYCSDLFMVNAEEKGITLKTMSHEESFDMMLDEDKFLKILTNLLSNAMKYTPEGGNITLFFDVISQATAKGAFPLTEKDTDSVYARISVQDSGPGIPVEERENVFRRYYQLDDTKEKGIFNYGTGIGLYFCRALVTLHHGYIKVEDRPSGSGAIFSFILPVHAASYQESEITTEESTDTGTSFHRHQEIIPEEEKTGQSSVESTQKEKIAVIDDDSDIVRFLKDLLSDRYLVSGYYDAASALESMKTDRPDLIISDIAMQSMNGLQLCAAVKGSLDLCHIPVILLTAKATTEDQIKGLEGGADAYVTKPFDAHYLTALAGSLLRNREALRRTLRESTSAETLDSNVLSPRDRTFLQKLYVIMEENLSNPYPDIADISSSLAMSRSKFYYKVKGLTGESPMDYIRSYKLNRAAEMLKTGEYNISEVADLTGFSTPSYFSTLFKKHFSVSPSDYRG